MKDIKYIIKRVLIGVGIGIILMLFKSNVFALTNTRDIVEINSTISYRNGGSNTITLRPTNTGDMFAYENQYFSDRMYIINSNRYYILGYFNLIDDSIPSWINTSNINFYYPNSCNSNEYANYVIRIRFYSQDNSKAKPNITSGLSSCTGVIEDIGSNNFDYVLNCNIQPNNAFAGSIYMSGFTYGPIYYRVSIQKNFNYSCEVNSQAIIENDNINTDRTIQAITDMNGNVTIVNNSINDLNNNINDDSPPSDTDLSSVLDPGNLPGGGPISQIISFPLHWFNRLISVFGSSCTDLNLTIPIVDKPLNIQCVNVYFNYMGFSVAYEAVGFLAGGVLLFYYLMYLFDRVNHLLFLEEKGDLKKYYS